jgi:hypothetical protein
MTDTDSTHPNSMSDADKQALRESDPAAFDDDAPAPTNEGDAAAAADAAADPAAASAGDPAADADAGAAAAPAADDASADAAAAAADAGAGTGKAPPAVVPKDRLDEVIDQRNQAERLSTQQAVELEQLRARLAALEAPKDYEAEYLAIEKKYDDGELDDAQKAAAIRQVSREEQAFIARRSAMQTQQDTLESTLQRTWEQEVAAFTQRNPGFLEAPGNADVFQRALNATAAFYGNTISQAELLNKAAKQAFEFTGYKSPNAQTAADLAGDPPAGDAGAERRAQNAARATDAGGTPPQIAGGVGERGGPNRGVDLDNLKPGTFSKKLSVEEQEKLLGPGAV